MTALPGNRVCRSRGRLAAALAFGVSLAAAVGTAGGDPDGGARLEGEAKRLNAQAGKAKNEGRYDDAFRLLRESLSRREAAYPKNRYPEGHLLLSESLNNLGELCRLRGELDSARDYLSRSLTMCRRLYPPDKYPRGHEDIVTTLNNLALVCGSQGDLAAGLGLFEEAIRFCERLYPKGEYPRGHPEFARCLSNAGMNLTYQGEYDKALRYLEQALAMREALSSEGASPRARQDLAVSCDHLGRLMTARREYEKAGAFLERSLAIRQSLFPTNRFPKGHPLLAMAHNNYAMLLQARGEPKKAAEHLRESVAINTAFLPPNRFPDGHPDLALTLNNLGMTLIASGDAAEGLKALESSLAMWEKLSRRDRATQKIPTMAKTLLNLGAAMQKRGAAREAGANYARALAVMENAYPADKYPEGHADVAACLAVLGAWESGESDHAAAYRHLARSLAMRQALVRQFADTASEAEVLNFLAELLPAQNGIWTLSDSHALPVRDILLSMSSGRVPVSDRELYSLVGRDKAILARVMERRHRSARFSADPATRAVFSQLQETRRRLAHVLMAPADPGRDNTRLLAGLTDEKERLERELARKSTPVPPDVAAGDPDGFVRLLPPNSAFVDFLRYNRFSQAPNRPANAGGTQTPSYVAFVLTPGKPAIRVDLGPAGPIDAAVEAWRKAVVEGGDNPGAAAELRRLVWEPLAKHLPDGTRAVYLAPDGALTRLPWAALPGDRPGTVLLERYALAVVPHGPFLLERLTPRDKPKPDAGTLLTVGGVPYDGAPAPVLLAALPGVDRPRAPDVRKGATWGELKNTAREAETIARLAAPRKAVALTGPDASTARLLAELPRARWAHLATHGFFADKQFRSAFRLDEKQFGADTRDRTAPGARSPLVLSGLVLAGANKPATNGGDGGILTAEAIVDLPLEGLDLAVLSACETGLGEVAGGEGVFGLQRAFHLAGTRDVVASLWRVNDEGTAALMTLFYHHLWKDNLPPIEALRKAQLTIYHHPERIKEFAGERGKINFDKVGKLPPTPAPGEAPKGKAPAKLWAGFTLSGPGRDFPAPGKGK